jgi:hypothetical protein
MTVSDVMKAIEDFSIDELRQLRAYIDQRENETAFKAGTVDMDQLLSGLAEIRAELSMEEFAEIERAMNEEYLPPTK